MTAITKRNRARYIYTNSKTICEKFLYTKSRTLCKKQDNLLMFWYSKSHLLYITHFFLKFLNAAFSYKNHETFRYRTLLYTESRHFAKALQYALDHQAGAGQAGSSSLTLSSCMRHFHIKTMELFVTGRFYIQKSRHFAKALQYALRFLIQKFWHFALRDFSLNFWNWRRGGYLYI